MNIAIIFAGGVGQRLNGANNTPKQFLRINDKPIIIHTLEIFQNNPLIDKIYIAIHPDYYEYSEAKKKKRKDSGIFIWPWLIIGSVLIISSFIIRGIVF